MTWKMRFWGLRPWKRHSLILMVAGLIYCFVGISYILAEPSRTRSIALQVLLNWMPLEAWGGVFILAGTLSVISSRWPPFTETWGYMVLTGLSMGWSSAYLFGILFFNSPWTNISGFFTWVLLAFLWWAISGLLNPDQSPVVIKSEQLGAIGSDGSSSHHLFVRGVALSESGSECVDDQHKGDSRS